MKPKTLEEIIESSGLSKAEIGRRIGITTDNPTQGVNIYIGGSDPTFKKAMQIASVLNISLKTLALAMNHDLSNISDRVFNDKEE